MLVGVGCSFLLDTAEPDQCASDADCEASPLLRNRACVSGFCVVPASEKEPVTVAGPPEEGCSTSELCTQNNSNRASLCRVRGGPCTPWQTDRCGWIGGNWSDPNAIVIGDIQPFTVRQFDGSRSAPAYARRVREAIDLALSEFEAAAPTGSIFGDVRRPFAVLHCDSGLDAEEAQAALQHLTDVVGAQAIILGADDDLASLTSALTEKSVAVACSDCIAPFPPGPLAWRILPKLELEAPMAAWRVARLEDEIKAGPSAPSALKVAVLVTPGRASDAFVTALTDKLIFNGKSAIANGERFAIVRTEDPGLTAVNHPAHADALVAFEPDVIVVATAGDFPRFYLPLIEEKWPAGKRRPHYITTDLNFHVTGFASLLEDNDDLRRRISGTRPGYSPALQANIDSFGLRYLQKHGKPPDEAHSGYDAFYALALAILGNRHEPLLDGPHISRGFERLHGGNNPTDFRPDQLSFATAVLGQATGNLDVRGLWSELDWNLATRDLEADVSMYCFARDGEGRIVMNPNAGPHLATSTGLVTGTYACP